MDCAFCGICPTCAFVNRETTQFLVEANDGVQRDIRWVRKEAILNKAHDLFRSLPVVSIEKRGLRVGILERPIGQEDFADICIKNFWRWYDVT